MLIVETKITQWMKTQAFNAQQRRLIVGSLLGDAHVVKTTQGYAYRANHGKAQREYIHWKYQYLKPFIRTEPKLSQEYCWHFRTVTHPEMSGFRSRWYEGNRKKLCIEDVEKHLDAFALAVWIMDDGAKDKNQLRLNSQCFNESENQKLQRFLQAKLKIKSTLNRDKKWFRIRIAGESMPKLVRMVRPHVISSMLYKLPL